MREELIARVRYLLEHPSRPFVHGLCAALSVPQLFLDGTRLEDIGEILSAFSKADLAPTPQKRQLNKRKRIVAVSDRQEEHTNKEICWFRLGDRI